MEREIPMNRISVKIFTLIAVTALVAALSGCGGSAATSGGGTLGEARPVKSKKVPRAGKVEETDTSWYSAEGTEFKISGAGQLAGLAKLVNRGNRFAGKTITLSGDVDLSGYNGDADFNEGKGWIPIGARFSIFKGDFDGGGNVVRGLYINDPTLVHAGLFGRVDIGSVKNLGVEDADITAGKRTGAVAGGLNNGAGIEQCHSSGSVKGKDNVGGVVGTLERKSKVSGCHSSAKVTGDNYVGGVIGDADGASSVTKSYATGQISGNEAVGGVAGGILQKGSGVSNSYSTGKITCGAKGGGVVGEVVDGAVVSNSYATGDVIGRTRVGGIAGHLKISGAIIRCVAINSSVKATGKDGFAGRILGQSDGSKSASGGNAAFTGIQNNAGSTEWPAKGDKNKDGADVTAIQISNDGTVEGRFTTDAGWTAMNGMLPGFKAAVRVPEHMR
ncbi:MAG: hypothetical protein FWB85_10265 [Chitinispirillia bacterium]|nr:hypothetical protein [Chitinispirillia bacterium]